jgi:ADP-ribose pyrophosphatase YjhB (NUDIX family)
MRVGQMGENERLHGEAHEQAARAPSRVEWSLSLPRRSGTSGPIAIGNPRVSDDRRLSARLRHWLFHTYFRFRRPMTLGVRAVILDAEGRVFLVRHGYVPGWHFPGGGVETGETLLDALRKEAMEEGRIEIRGRPVLHGVFFNSVASPRDHVAVYVVREFEVLGQRAPDAEIAETGWFARDALPDGASKGTRRRLAEIVDGEPIADRWV